MLIKIHRSTIVLSGISNPKQQCSHEYIYILYCCDYIFDVTLCVLCRNNNVCDTNDKLLLVCLLLGIFAV